MKLLSFTILIVALLGLMVFTNPSLDDYNNFIRQSIVKESHKERPDSLGNVLAPLFGGIASSIVAGQTVRNDYILFSVYEAQFGRERLKAVGVLKNFIVLEHPNPK